MRHGVLVFLREYQRALAAEALYHALGRGAVMPGDETPSRRVFERLYAGGSLVGSPAAYLPGLHGSCTKTYVNGHFAMIEDARGRVDYHEAGSGPTVVLVPGSCSTGAAWRPVISNWSGRYRCITTSLLGYGGTSERRTARDTSICHVAEAVETVVRRADRPAHLVGHSFGALVALAVALRTQVPLASLVIVEAPAVSLLADMGDCHYHAFRQMTDAYFAGFRAGDGQAIRSMIDFYGGGGTFASWPPRVRDYAVETTAVNILDWASAYDFPLTSALLAAIDIPTLVVRGGASHAAVQRANELLSASIRGAALHTIAGAAHFMIMTHAHEVARLIDRHVGPDLQQHRRPIVSPTNR
jgi:pimeloyl-ACP methyl ester carboxylesterase